MRRLQAFQYTLMPNGAQQRLMRRFAGSCRFVYNKALALQKARYEQKEKRLSYVGLCKELTGWRHDPDTVWLADAPAQPLQQSLKDLERAYTNFFEKRAAFPRFKKKGQHDAFRYPAPDRSRLMKPTAGFVSLSWGGYAIATVARCWGPLKTSPCVVWADAG